MGRKADRRIKIRRTVDGKRTDRVKKAERERMLRLRNQGKTIEEIALELDRSERTVSKQLAKGGSQVSQKEEKRIQPWIEKAKQEGTIRHFTDLADTAEILANNMNAVIGFPQWLADNVELPLQEVIEDFMESKAMDGNIVDGGNLGIPLQGGGRDIVEEGELKTVDSLLADCLLQHFNHRFPELAYYRDWREVNFRNIKQEIIDKLRLLVHSKNFGVCPTCPVCKDLQV